jgi:hypothetical protein
MSARLVAVVCWGLLAAACASDEERAAARRLDAWLDVVERAARGDVEDASPVPMVCSDVAAKARAFAERHVDAGKLARFVAACRHDAPVAWVRADLSWHAARGASPLCALDRQALAALPAAERAREAALVAEVARACDGDSR